MLENHNVFGVEVDGLPGTDRVWELDEKELVVDAKPFARGAFSHVHKGEYFGTPVCVKVLRKDDPQNTELLKFIRREISSLKFSHPNIVQLIGVAEKQDEIYIVTEYVAGGNLRQFLKDKNVLLPWELRVQIAIDIASGMAFLHSKNVMHRDLKSKNLLVEDNWHIKVCDFGFARSVHSNRRQLMTVCGTGEWMAPEVMLGHPYDFKADVFSFGMVLVEILTRAKVGEDIRRGYDTEYSLDTSLFESLVPSDCPAELVRVALQCCSNEPHTRPSFKEITKRLKAVKDICPLATNEPRRCRDYREPALESPPLPTRNAKNKKNQATQPSQPLSTVPPTLPTPLAHTTPLTSSSKKKDKGFLKIPLIKSAIAPPNLPEVSKPATWATSWETPAIQNTNAAQRMVSANPLYQPVFAESPLHDHRGWVHFER